MNMGIFKGTFGRILCALLVVLCMVSALPGTAFAEEGILPSGLAYAELADAVETFVEEHRDTTAAVSVSVLHGQETLFSGTYGLADIAAVRAAHADTVFEWGSVTQPLV